MHKQTWTRAADETTTKMFGMFSRAPKLEDKVVERAVWRHDVSNAPDVGRVDVAMLAASSMVDWLMAASREDWLVLLKYCALGC